MAQKALALDEALAEAHASNGIVKFAFDWDWAGAERDLARAAELNPSSAMVHQWYNYFLMVMDRRDAALAEARRALELDPLSPISNMGLGNTLFYARRYDDAVMQLQKTVELDPSYMPARMFLGYCYALKGMDVNAITEGEKARGLSPSDPAVLGTLGYILASSGRQAEARRLAERLEQQSKRAYVEPLFVAMTYPGLGETDRAFAWLEKGYEQRSSQMCSLKIEIALDSLRTDPRYHDLLRRMRFPN